MSKLSDKMWICKDNYEIDLKKKKERRLQIFKKDHGSWVCFFDRRFWKLSIGETSDDDVLRVLLEDQNW